MDTHDALAEFAVKDINSGMVVGLGTGRTASRCVRALARRVNEENLDVRCVSTSRQTTELATELGLTLINLSEALSIDLLFDGADEVDENLVMLKGRGGAMTREKIVAHAAERRLYLVQKDKLVENLGATGPLPVEVLPAAAKHVMGELFEYELESRLRVDDAGNPFVTDDGGHVLLVEVPEGLEPTVDTMLEFSLAVKHIPGVIEHGLFVDEADAVLVEGETDEDMELYLREDPDDSSDEN